MESSSLLVITLALSLPSLGSFLNSHGISKERTQSTETVVHPVSEVVRRNSSVQGSGDRPDTLIRPIPEETGAQKEMTPVAGSAVTLRHSVTGTADSRSSVTMLNVVKSQDTHLKGRGARVDIPAKTGVDHPAQTRVFPPMTNFSGSGRPCVRSPCQHSYNGTNLLWDDMRRTLAFAWEIHVFGSAGLFILMASVAVLGMAVASGLPYPHCGVLMLANSTLIASGALRAVHLLLDPYGTRQIVSHATLAALQNVPMQLFLWAQVTLTLVTPRRFKLILFPVVLQQPHVVAGLLVSHCSVLLAADLHFTAFFPLFPLLLQMLSLSWGLPFCLEILLKSLSRFDMFLGSSVPRGVPSQRIERCAKRVTAVCACLGIMSCSLQICSLLWLYGLMGNWRRFGWCWWLSQFWARILELAWGSSLLVLGSWIFWMPARRHSRREVSKREGKTSGLWDRVLAWVRKGQLKRSEKKWRELMPNNLAKRNFSSASFSNSPMCPYDDQPSVIVSECKHDPSCSNNYDSQATLMWQRVGERECILSLIEFDTRPPSPINLRLNVDSALHHGQLLAGSLFTPPPPSWMHSDAENGTATFPPAYVGYGWMMDTESIPASLDHFQDREPTEPGNVATDHSYNGGSPKLEFSSRFAPSTHENDWSDEDVTDL
ncbi:proline-rich transmembrane protein 3-like isoform X2 [Syngnathoides biaculeatus]|uniref:proline-rich transmembrane protein 3-like isoform X2 n=1 Tax=Syngnathoides biaculeatus TaxID=300417 RepID=UPI002ADE573A|nr:proline-rich transmembrane protein 3-like isoform X2 [Syngnathoides biaculeatus]